MLSVALVAGLVLLPVDQILFLASRLGAFGLFIAIPALVGAWSGMGRLGKTFSGFATGWLAWLLLSSTVPGVSICSGLCRKASPVLYVWTGLVYLVFALVYMSIGTLIPPALRSFAGWVCAFTRVD